MLFTPEKAQATARWFVQQGILRQFDLAREIEKEEVEECTPFLSKAFREKWKQWFEQGAKASM